MHFDFEDIDLSRLVFLPAPAFKEFREIKIPKEVKILNPLSKRHPAYINLENQIHVSDLYKDFNGNDFTSKFEEGFKSIIKDYRWSLLSERRSINSNTFYLAKLKQLVYGCCKFIEENKIDILIAAGVPHCIETWAFTYLLEKIYSGKIYVIDYSPVPGFVSLYYGLDKLTPLKLNSKFETLNIKKDIRFKKYIQLQKQDSNALDSKGRLGWLFDLDGYNAWRFSSLKHFPQRLIQKLYSKFIFRKYFKNINKVFPLPEKSVVFFMHFQPEATSLPVGLEYCEQFNAISSLRAAFPNEYNIYVKEHPYTYKQPIDPRFRPPQYYEIISSLKGVYFIDPYFPSYDLMDQAEFVSTLVGKVGLQSLLRKTPVIAFGAAPYRHHNCCIQYESKSHLVKFIKKVKEFDFTEENQIFIEGLEDTCVSGYSENSENIDYDQARIKGLAEISRVIFDNC